MTEKKSRLFKAFLLVLILAGAGYLLYSRFLVEDVVEEEVVSVPVFELPVRGEDLGDVTKIQTFHDPDSSELHVGFDFAFEESKEIVSPIGGTVSSVHKHRMSNGLWLVSVNIQVNSEWSTFIAFEPDTSSETVIDQQYSRIVVERGDEVVQGQLLGTLLIEGDFAHIHWSVLHFAEYVRPYDYCSDTAKAQLDSLIEEHG